MIYNIFWFPTKHELVHLLAQLLVGANSAFLIVIGIIVGVVILLIGVLRIIVLVLIVVTILQDDLIDGTQTAKAEGKGNRELINSYII